MAELPGVLELENLNGCQRRGRKSIPDARLPKWAHSLSNSKLSLIWYQGVRILVLPKSELSLWAGDHPKLKLLRHEVDCGGKIGRILIGIPPRACKAAMAIGVTSPPRRSCVFNSSNAPDTVVKNTSTYQTRNSRVQTKKRAFHAKSLKVYANLSRIPNPL